MFFSNVSSIVWLVKLRLNLPHRRIVIAVTTATSLERDNLNIKETLPINLTPKNRHYGACGNLIGTPDYQQQNTHLFSHQHKYIQNSLIQISPIHE